MSGYSAGAAAARAARGATTAARWRGRRRRPGQRRRRQQRGSDGGGGGRASRAAAVTQRRGRRPGRRGRRRRRPGGHAGASPLPKCRRYRFAGRPGRLQVCSTVTAEGPDQPARFRPGHSESGLGRTWRLGFGQAAAAWQALVCLRPNFRCRGCSGKCLFYMGSHEQHQGRVVCRFSGSHQRIYQPLSPVRVTYSIHKPVNFFLLLQHIYIPVLYILNFPKTIFI